VSVVANVAINVDSRGATQKLREVQNQAQQTERAFGGLNSAVGKLVGAFAAAQAVRFVFVQAAEIQTQTRSLEVLTGSVQKATQIVKELQDIGAVTPFTSSELIDAAKRLQAFGVETNKVVDTTRRLADVSGATGAELQGLVTAYGQVQAKGRLQGEELLQFQERGVALQKVLKEEYKLSGQEFQDALEKGRISAEAVEAAIIKLTDAGGKYANGAIAQSDTLNGKLSTLQDSFQRLAQNIGTFFEPVFKFLIDGVNALLERLNSAARIGAEARAYEEANRRTRTRFGALRYANPFDQEVQQYRERLTKSLVASEMGVGAAGRTPTMGSGAGLPPLLAPRGKAGGDGKKGLSDAEREAKRLAEELKRSLEIGDQLGTQFSRQVVLLDTASETERQRLQIQFDYEDRAKQIAELKNAEQRLNLTTLNDEIKRLETSRLQTDELKKQIEEYYKLAGLTAGEMLGEGAGAFRTDINLDPNNRATEKADELKRKFNELIDPINMAATGAQSIGDAFGTAFQSIITGAQSTQQALAGFFKSVGESFINMATEIIAQMVVMYSFKQLLGLFGGGGGGLFSGAGPVAMPGGGGFAEGFSMPKLFANGGFVTGPTNALIGEGGEPEYVIPASKMRGAMSRYSAGARGSGVIPSGSGDGATMGATMTAAPIDVRYTVERINSVDYVTADQFQAGMRQAASQGAERGQQLALRRLQQSPSTRRRVGI
jgi:tape measure domain-containing protein